MRSLQDTLPSIGPNVFFIPLVVSSAGGCAAGCLGRLTDRRWTVVAASTLAMPTLWTHSLATLVGIAGAAPRHAGGNLWPAELRAAIDRWRGRVVPPAAERGLSA